MLRMGACATMNVVITGTGRGIGAALAVSGRASGWNVIECRRDQATPKDTQLMSDTALEMDVTQPMSIRNAFNKMATRISCVDVLVNNAGTFPEPTGSPFAELEPEWFMQAFQVNCLGTALVTQACLPLLLKSNHPRIINMSSGAASITRRSGRRYCYGASKAALNHLTRGLAHELKNEGVTVVALSPGWVRTDMGGPEAELDAVSVAADLTETINGLDMEQSGHFLDRFGRIGTYDW